MKASLHQSGRCHVRAPDPSKWRGTGEPPKFLDSWHMDIGARYQFPFAVVIPEQELRQGEWAQYRDKGTIWIDASPGSGVEIAIFLVRASGDPTSSLAAAGWDTVIVDASIPDGRRLIVAAGDATPPHEKLAELELIKRTAHAMLEKRPEAVRSPRMLLLAGPNEEGTRKFIEAAVY